MLLGDSLLFVAGPLHGMGPARLSLQTVGQPRNLHPAIGRIFYKRGKATLLFAKFIPGINTMAPPLAGSMKMRPDIFCGSIWREPRSMRWSILRWAICSAMSWLP